MSLDYKWQVIHPNWLKWKGNALSHMTEKFWCNAGIGCGSVERLNMPSRLDFSLTLSLELAFLQVGLSFNHMLLYIIVKRELKQLQIKQSQIQVPPEKARLCFPKSPSKSLIFSSLTLIGSCDYTPKYKDQEWGRVDIPKELH